MKLPSLFASLLFFAFSASAAHAELLERDCKGKTGSGKKIEASLQLFSDDGHITIDGRGYKVKFEKETRKGNKYSSNEHSGIGFKIDFKGRYVVGESDKLGKFELTCKQPNVTDDDDSDGDIDLPSLYFSGDTDT
jgi:hypothetical protein